VPLLIAFLGDVPPGRDWMTEMSVALGFVGLSMLGLQFVVTARSRLLASPYGMDLVLRFHRGISLVAFTFILAHPILLFITDPATLELLRVWDAPWRARFGVLSVVALIAIVVTSTWRERVRLSYEAWRLLHGILAVVIVATALVHVQLVGHYVSTVWKQALWAVLSVSLVSVLFHVRVIQPFLLFRRPWEVVDVERVGDDVHVLRLRPVGHPGLDAQPGQYAWITVHRSPFSVVEHPFTMSGSAEDPDGIIRFTIKALGDWTSAVGDIEPGSIAYVDGPHGVFSPDRAEGAGYVLIAGGIGVTPMLSILHTMADREDRRPHLLIHAAPTADELIGADEVEALRHRMDLEVVQVVEHPDEGWTGETGIPDADMLDRLIPERGRDRLQYFVCGPPPMLDAVEVSLEERGIPVDRIHVERFDLA
jgi:predicted ferric reductase